MEGLRVLQQLHVQASVVLLQLVGSHVVGLALTRIVELRAIFVLIDVSVVSHERELLPKLFRRLLADSIGLLWECAYA